MWYNLIILIVNLLILAINCIILGTKLQNLPKIEVNPIKKHKKSKEEQDRQRKFDTLWANIENYDGSNFGQKEIN